MRFAISIPQLVADGTFDPAAFRGYMARAESLGFESARTGEQVLGSTPHLDPMEVDEDTARGRQRIAAALDQFYGYFGLRGIEAVAVYGPPEACAKGLGEVAQAGAELILLNPLYDEAEQMERLAAEVVPRLSSR
jgi:hypothetical protein